jgi:hypothetical protein
MWPGPTGQQRGGRPPAHQGAPQQALFAQWRAQDLESGYSKLFIGLFFGRLKHVYRHIVNYMYNL